MPFALTSEFEPTGDQPEAIRQLVDGINSGERFQTLLGVTGSGKTFTIANVIQQMQKPALIISHNKTLAAQLYGEFKQFFPENLVGYFISYYDYYQPEAFIPSTGLYIEKDASINEEIEKLRLRATNALLSGREDIIIVASVSCIYGIGKPEDYARYIVQVRKGEKISRRNFLHNLVQIYYSRNDVELKRGNFRVKGDTVDVFPAYEDEGLRFVFFGDEIESVQRFEITSGKKIQEIDFAIIYPANLFVTPKETLHSAMKHIQDEMVRQEAYFKAQGMYGEAKRILERTTFDMEMMREVGYCSGIENYSRYLSQREAGSRPYCLLDYFPDDFLIVIDESHATVPQIRGMYNGDRQRKMVLVENGFRLPSALDNRPLKFEEFESLVPKAIFLSATPADYELEKSQGVIVEQIVRPTGLLDPPVEVRPSANEIDDLLGEIDACIQNGERVLVTTLTKRMSEELSKYLANLNIRVRYLHSDIEALERVEILRELRLGDFDVLVGINLLREGLDLPEVSLVAILDADKEGFLRSTRSLIQTAGRAARNINGKVILYGDRITDSMKRLLEETERRRSRQIAYNIANNITPKSIIKSKESILVQTAAAEGARMKPVRRTPYGGKMPPASPAGRHAYIEQEEPTLAADPVVQYMSKPALKQAIAEAKKKMERAAKDLDFLQAAKYRDEMFALEKMLTAPTKSG